MVIATFVLVFKNIYQMPMEKKEKEEKELCGWSYVDDQQFH